MAEQEQIRILHLGLGRFHRAHQAVYYQNLSEDHSERWPVAAFSMRTAEASESLKKAHFTYPVIVLEKESAHLKNIDVICKSYFIQTDRLEYLKLMALSHVQMITLTVTEKGYSLNAQGELDSRLIAEDLKKFENCSSAVGFLYYGLRHRCLSGGYPITILSCDNLRDNGHRLKTAVLSFAKLMKDPRTAEWIEQQVSFPNTMVDRIVPQLSTEKITELQKEFNTENPEIVATESFSQWVIEDNFRGERPALEKVGVQFVKSVQEHENIKLRVLNAAHSLLAYAGLLKSYNFVHEAVNNKEIRAAVENLWAEVSQQISIPNGYREKLLRRFDNPRLPHSLKQIAMDGSQKLPQRLLPNLKTRQLSECPSTEYALRCWAEYCYRHTPDDPQKPLIERLKAQATDLDDFKKRLFREVLGLI